VGALLTPLSGYSIVAAALFTLGVAGPIIWLARRRALRAHTGLLLAGLGLAAMTLLVPDQAGGGSWISRRVPTLILLTILASLQIKQRAEPRYGLGLGLAALALVTAQAAWMSWTWRTMDGNLSAVRRVLAGVPAGATVLPLQHVPTLAMRWRAPAGRYVSGVGDPTFRHYGALATPLRRAFVPNLFSARGLQPLQVRGEWNRYVEHNGGELASVNALARARQPGDPAYLDQWRARFDYILVMNADLPDARGKFRPPRGVDLISDAGFAQLWRIDHEPGAS
jgi:hypothetical protein